MVKNEAPFKVGDLVKTTFRKKEPNIVRKITEIWSNSPCGSGWSVSVDGGERCLHVGE